MISQVVGYAGFKSYGDSQISFLKPGQRNLHREDYYKHVTQEEPQNTNLLKNYSRFKSTYDVNQNKNVKLGDYQVPAKSMNTMTSYELVHKPKLFDYTTLGKAAAASIHSSRYLTGEEEELAKKETVQKFIQPTEHWKSSASETNRMMGESQKIRSVRPAWSIPRQAYCSNIMANQTEFQDSFGRHGHRPRETMPLEAQSMINKCNDLTIGTSKVTSHIPGYKGFLPYATTNERCVQQSQGESTRTTIIKQNIVENQAVRLPGYTGHKPMSVINDRGKIRQNCLNTEGENYQHL